LDDPGTGHDIAGSAGSAFGVIYCFYYYYLLLHRYASPTENRMVVTRAAVSGVGGCGEVMSRLARIMISRSEEVLAMEDKYLRYSDSMLCIHLLTHSLYYMYTRLPISSTSIIQAFLAVPTPRR